MATKEEVLEKVEKDGVKFVNLQFVDILGIVKNATIPAVHLGESLDNGTWFDGSSIEGFARIHESDMYLKPDPETYAVIPWLDSNQGNTARLICDVYSPDGNPFAGDPRHILKQTVEKARNAGYEYYTGPEFEFFLFKKENGNVLGTVHHDVGGYFDLNMDEAYEVRKDITIALQKFGMNVEAAHHEVANSQHEIDFKYDKAVKTADNAATFKFVVKAIAKKHGLMATFMPKPIRGINGSGMHVHQSLFKDGQNIFYDENDKYNLSETARNFVAGQMKHVQGMSAILSPLVNSYKRLVPGYEAPVYICWATTNRSALIRIPRIVKGRKNSARVELRCPDPSSNIYLVFSTMLAAGMEGIEQKLIPPDPVEENLYLLDEEGYAKRGIKTLPCSLGEALECLKKDELMKRTLGEHIFTKYREGKKSEWNDYMMEVTKWEVKNFLEAY
ncbi:MAG: type I glutamate--ammonia ligase [Candidatus Micrarchaeota archaeon]